MTMACEFVTTILKWPAGKRCAFFMAFDDACRTHISNVIPLLRKRGMVGTFYISPNMEYFKEQKEWEREPDDSCVKYGNHSFSHSDVSGDAQLDFELASCNEAIKLLTPGRKWPRLISYCEPGGTKWTVNDEIYRAILKRYNLVVRPAFHGFPMNFKTVKEADDYVDKTIASEGIGHFDFHGVGGDWHITPLNVFIGLLDKLEAHKDQIWLTDHISCHKYLIERDAAEIHCSKFDGQELCLKLETKVDPSLYDLPLTLETCVPSTWGACIVTQNNNKHRALVANGKIRYEAEYRTSDIIITLSR